jgi:hypothetical protein
VVCGQACIDARLLQQAENMVVPRPHDVPDVTQAQLDARRQKIERNVRASDVQNTGVKRQRFYEAKEAPQRERLSGAGGPPGGGPRKPPEGCFAEPDQPLENADAQTLFSQLGQAAQEGPRQPPGPTYLVTHQPSGAPGTPVLGPHMAPGVDVGSLALVGIALLQAIIQKYRGRWEGDGC